MKLEERKKCSNEGCSKEVYRGAEEAREEIERILTTQRKINDVKPARAYKCDCGWYCLTSKPKITEY